MPSRPRLPAAVDVCEGDLKDVASIDRALEGCAAGTPVIWVQEEPQNMGAWCFLRDRLGEKLFERFPLGVVTRPESASPGWPRSPYSDRACRASNRPG